MLRSAPSFLLLAFLLGTAPALTAQQQQQNNPSAPQPIPGTPFQGKKLDCSGSAKPGKNGKWDTTSTCPQPDPDKPPPLKADRQDSKSDNAFPQEQSQKAADSANGQQQPAAPSGSTAKDNPFPEEQSQKAAQQANKPAAQPSGNFSSSRNGLNQLDLLGNSASGASGYHIPPGVHDPRIAAEDVRVGTFYLNAGNDQGAYNRFKDATVLDPGNAEAVFQLAEAARNLGKTQEAEQNYQLYLAALPKGPKAKDAKKALQKLQKGK
ncbi:tetratricopeptide repeat protein [Acidipila rosea]|uniref:Uncharacterized protein n=1 Tax=Acidipila rosea TaxID=768535 RepID=A0A4R1LAK6_9BACT|nr:tetratricopeptide repeat protein [Acidipila rosea]TCK73499.1 hypothetical protein C7378_1112 [Acidipila rosea]